MEASLDKETAKKLQTWKDRITTSAEDVIFRVFPEKILELDRIIETAESDSSPYHPSHALAPGFTDTTVYPPPLTQEEPETKKRKLDVGSVNGSSALAKDAEYARYPNLVRTNEHVNKLHEVTKKEAEELARSVDKIRVWINLTMPKIEDGDNFGVQVQEDVLSELQRSQESAYALRDVARQDHLNRAKICSKIIKYPHIEDYTLALKEHDQKQLYNSKQWLVDMRNVYAIVMDVLHKNITKIRAPKGNNSVGLY